MTKGAVLEGGCLCGAVRYRAQGDADHRMVCHCESCRRAAGSPVVAWVTFPAADFEFFAGEPVAFQSSAHVTRTFCGRCGTPLTYQRSDEAESIDVTTCSFDEPDTLPPTHHSWLEDSVSWVRFGDGLPTHRKTSRDG